MAAPADIGLFTTDASLVIRSWDAWLEAATGIAREAAVGQPLTAVIPDLDARGLRQRFEDALGFGGVQVLATALHRFLIPCPPRRPSRRFGLMQQRVTIGPIRDGREIVGVMVAIEDVTPRVEIEREVAGSLAADDWRVRAAAVAELKQVADGDVVVSIVESLRHEHRNFSLLSSAMALLSAGSVDVTQPLIGLLRDEDADLRIQAALALGEQHDTAAISALRAALSDADANVRFHAIESLGRLRAESAVDDLMAIVESGDFYLSFAALDALAAIDDPRVGPRLVALLDRAELRLPVADALAALGDATAIAPLVAVLNASGVVAAPVAGALVAIHDRYEREFGDGAAIADTIRREVTPAALPHVLDAIASAATDQLVPLVRVLAWFDGDSVERTLTRLLREPAVRAEVIEALVRHGDRVVDLLVDQLHADDRETRHAAIVALGRVGSRRATAALVGLLADDDGLLVAIAGALARIGDPEAFEPLLPLLAHPDAAVRQSAIGALNSIGHPDMPRRVAALLQSADALARESAVRIAGYFGYAETTGRLFDLLRDPDEAVRRAVIEHLPFIEDARVEPALLEALAAGPPRARAAAARALGRVDSARSRASLRGALADGDAWVRYFAARALGDLQDKDAVAALAERALHDPAMHVRIAAIDALGAVGSAETVAVLKSLVRDHHGEISAAAVGALGRLAAVDGLPDIQHALRATDANLRTAAVSALAAHGSVDAVMLLEWTAAADADAEVAKGAVAALGAVTGAGGAGADAALAALTTLLADRTRRENVIDTLARLPRSRIADVARGLRHADPEIRRATIDVLARFHDEEATRCLSAALTDEARSVRDAAVRTLMRIGSRRLDLQA
jgi:HEAT repeat protein